MIRPPPTSTLFPYTTLFRSSGRVLPAGDALPRSVREHLRRLRKGCPARVKLGIMQPYLFPYVGYFQLLNAVDRFVVYDDVAFIKQGWINRNRILINGHAAYFTVPVKHASSFSLIRDPLVDDDRQHARWAEKTLTTFSNTYRRAPEFA